MPVGKGIELIIGRKGIVGRAVFLNRVPDQFRNKGRVDRLEVSGVEDLNPGGFIHQLGQSLAEKYILLGGIGGDHPWYQLPIPKPFEKRAVGIGGAISEEDMTGQGSVERVIRLGLENIDKVVLGQFSVGLYELGLAEYRCAALEVGVGREKYFWVENAIRLCSIWAPQVEIVQRNG